MTPKKTAHKFIWNNVMAKRIIPTSDVPKWVPPKLIWCYQVGGTWVFIQTMIIPKRIIPKIGVPKCMVLKLMGNNLALKKVNTKNCCTEVFAPKTGLLQKVSHQGQHLNWFTSAGFIHEESPIKKCTLNQTRAHCLFVWTSVCFVCLSGCLSVCFSARLCGHIWGGTCSHSHQTA